MIDIKPQMRYRVKFKLQRIGMVQDKAKSSGLVNTIINPGVVLNNREFLALDKRLSLFLRKTAPQR